MTTEQRIERLERENRWIRRGGAVLFAVVAAVVLVAQGKDDDKAPDHLTVKSLSVLDKQGVSRITLMTGGDIAVIKMFGPFGTGAGPKNELNLYAGTKSHGLKIVTEGGEARLFSHSRGDAGLSVSAGGKQRCVAFVRQAAAGNSTAGMRLNDSDGKAVWREESK